MLEVLTAGRRLGFLGPGPAEAHVRHAEGFAQAYEGSPGRAVDLGSGGGVPGLVLALAWPETLLSLIESIGRRADFLMEAVDQLGLGSHVEVLHRRAEDVGRDPGYRGRADVVVARSFGPPAAVAECGAPLLSKGGRLVVSEPPSGDSGRWPEGGLARLGLQPVGLVETDTGRFQVLEQMEECPERFPRRSGLPAKRPLF